MTCPSCGTEDVRTYRCGGIVIRLRCEPCGKKWVEPPISVSTRVPAPADAERVGG